MLAETLAHSRDAILDRWIESVIAGYPEDTARFLRRQSDRFANPVGASLREGLAEVLDGVLEGAKPGALEPALDRVIRVRAVQDLSPAAAVGFVFELKRLLRDGLGDGQAGATAVLAEIESSVDRAALTAFEVYMRCREQVWAIRNAEVRNLSVGIMERVAEWRARREAGEDAPRNQ